MNKALSSSSAVAVLRPAAAAAGAAAGRRPAMRATRKPTAAAAAAAATRLVPPPAQTLTSAGLATTRNLARRRHRSHSLPRARPRSAEAQASSTSACVTAASSSSSTRFSEPVRYYAGGASKEEEEQEEAERNDFSSSPPLRRRRETVGVPLPLFDNNKETSEMKALELPRALESPTDDPSLANPLQRLNRMSTGWMGVIFECDGVTLPATPRLHDAAWEAVAASEGKNPPKRWELRRADGMKAEQAVSEAFHWARSPPEVRRLARLKEEAFDKAVIAAAAAAAANELGENDKGRLTSSSSPSSSSSSSSSATAVVSEAAPPSTSTSASTRRNKVYPVPGVARFLETLASHGVPAALTSPEPLERLESILDSAVGISRSSFAAVVAGDDVARCRPDAEPYLLAAARLGRPPSRCVLIGNSNASVEAARDAGMAVVAVAPRSLSDAASAAGQAAMEAALAEGASAAEARVEGQRAAKSILDASAGSFSSSSVGPRAYELGAADLVVRGGLDGLTMADLKSLFRYETLKEAEEREGEETRNGGDDDDCGASSSSDLFFDEFDSSARSNAKSSPWDSSPPSSNASSSSNYGGLFDDTFDDADDFDDDEDDADDFARELQLRR